MADRGKIEVVDEWHDCAVHPMICFGPYNGQFMDVVPVPYLEKFVEMYEGAGKVFKNAFRIDYEMVLQYLYSLEDE